MRNLKSLALGVLAMVFCLGNVAIVQADNVDELIKRLEDKDGWVRWKAAKVLGETGDTCAVKPLIVALKDEDSWVRREAVEALSKIGKPAVEPLIVALKDEDSWVREGAAKVLGGIGDTRAVEPLNILISQGRCNERKEIYRLVVNNFPEGAIKEPKECQKKDKTTYRRPIYHYCSVCGAPAMYYCSIRKSYFCSLHKTYSPCY